MEKNKGKIKRVEELKIMLTRHDLRWIYGLFKLMSSLNLIPVTFDPVTGQMRRQTSVKRNVIFKIWLLLGLTHISYIGIRTGQAIFFMENETHKDFFPMMSIILFGFLTFFLFLYLPFGPGIVENVAVFNEILRMRGKEFPPPKYNFKFF